MVLRNILNYPSVLVVLAWGLLAFSVPHMPAAEESAGVRIALFNGENLDGWEVTNCQVGVEDGALVILDGNGFVRSLHRYGDCVFEWKTRARKAEQFDSGIYVRAELPAEGKNWPARYQINLKQGDEGNLIGIPEARSQGLTKAGEWNAYRLTLVGKSAALEINGQPAWKTDKLESTDGYFGIQVEVPLGGQFEFRDLYVTELGYRSLFNEKDLAGWEGADAPAEKCWKVEEQLLVCTGEKGPWLRSLEQFGDFRLRLEYKLKAGGNSGVYVRVPKDGNHHGPNSGVEIQILDDQAERYKDLKPYQYTGSVYAIAPADKHVGGPPGSWNALEIDVQGQQYRIYHNGILIVNANDESFPLIKERLTSGYLGLQNHSEEVWFRNIRLLSKTQ